MTISTTCSLAHFNALLAEVPKVTYIVLPMRLMQYMNQDRKLKDQDRILWLYLFQSSYFDREERSIKISLSKLTNELGHCKNTLIKSLKRLEDAGYIIRQKAYSHSYHMPYEILIRFPNNVKLAADEREKKQKSNNGTQSTNEIVGLHDDPLLVQNMNPSRFISCTSYINNNYINNNNKIERLIPAQPMTSFSHEKSQNANNLNLESDAIKNQTPSAPHLNLSSEYSYAFTLKEIEYLEKKEIEENKILTHLMQDLARFSKDDELAYQDAFRKMRSQSEFLSYIEQNLTRLNSHKKKIESLMHSRDPIPQLFANERNLSDPQINRIRAALLKIYPQIVSQDIELLITEIKYAVQFGSLKFQQGTQELLPTEKAVNVALMLVRQKRWTTPLGVNVPKGMEDRIKSKTGTLG